VNEGFLASVLLLGGRIVDGALGRLTGGVIHHQADSGDYFPDRDVAYQAPDPCPDDAFARFRRDRYRFETDGWAAGVAFKCPPTTTTTLVCPAPGMPGRFTNQGDSCTGWSGSFKYVYTTDEVYSFSDGTGSYSKDNHLRIEGVWSIVGTGAPVAGEVFDTIDTTWAGTYSLTKVEAEHRDFCVGQVSDVTATVLDCQGNRTTVKVRFWVAPADFRVLSLEAAAQSQDLFNVRFENPDALTAHTILWSDSVGASLGGWSLVPILGWEAESNRVRRVAIQVPPGPSNGFLRVLLP